MIKEFLHVFSHAIMITGFVFVMMLAIEYINVQTKGVWQKNLSSSKWKHYFFAAFLGAIPGCLGAFTAVALFSHRLISFGAIVTAMIATSGDEAFVMFAMFPEQAAILTLLLFVIAILSGFLVDKFSIGEKFLEKFNEKSFPIHTEEQCDCFPKNVIIKTLLKSSIYRLSLLAIVISLLLAVGFGFIADDSQLWMQITIIVVTAFSLFVVATVPEHFLKKHLWDHIVKVHILRIFLWTFGTLLAVHLLIENFDVSTLIADNMLLVLVVAVLVGMIPESGPHLVFVTLFASGTIPFYILLASSISQDGHGMLPLLAESKKGFIAVKVVNVIIAFIIGLIGYLVQL
ncbi:MAG: putative manganese transporter [Melioribacteraceae bacterium]